MTTQPSTGPRPRTEAGREYADRLAMTMERLRSYITVPYPSKEEVAAGINANVIAIEAEARAAAFTAVEEAVRRLNVGWTRVDDQFGPKQYPWVYLRDVLAVLAKLQEDALHPADKEAETSHE